jgi:hypothetical protein
MTGRGVGYCAGYDRPGFANPIGGRFGFGRGYGRGNGRGFGYGRGYSGGGYVPNVPYYPPVDYAPNPQDEKAYLENEMNALKNEMEAIEKRLKEIGKSK